MATRQVTPETTLLAAPVHGERVPCQYLRLAEASRRFSVHKRTLGKWIAEGRIRAVRVNRTVLVPEAELSRVWAAVEEATAGKKTVLPCDRLKHKNAVVKVVAAAFNRARLEYVAADYHSTQRGHPTFLVLTRSPEFLAVKGVVIWVINERKKPTPRQRQLETLFTEWRYKTLFVFSPEDCLEEMRRLGYRGFE